MSEYPTLHAIGLGPQLKALERICSASESGKYAGRSVVDRTADHHFAKADAHMCLAGYGYRTRDEDSGEFHLLHAASRLLMAAACVEDEDPQTEEKKAS